MRQTALVNYDQPKIIEYQPDQLRWSTFRGREDVL